VFLRRVFVPFSLEHFERINQLPTRLPRWDYCVHVSSFGSHVWIGESVAEFFDLLLADVLAAGGVLLLVGVLLGRMF